MFFIAKEGLSLIIPIFLLTVLLYIINSYILAFICLFILLFLIFFFRDPERIDNFPSNIILSPADGKILSIEEIDENTYLNEKSYKISIFLSVFNVHITRSPYLGIIENVSYKKGKFWSAFKDCASKENENNTLFINCHKFKIIVKQIAGLIARRIVCNVKENMDIERGQKLGIIKFGSRVELFIPHNFKLKIKTGQKVKGGKTVIGEFN